MPLEGADVFNLWSEHVNYCVTGVLFAMDEVESQ
jgi:hypothetical protein